MNSIIFIYKLTCESWIPCLRAYGYGLCWYLLFELVFPVGMVMVVPVGYPVDDSINIFIGLLIGISFGTWEGSLVKVSLGTISGLMIGTGEGYFVGLSLLPPLALPFESQILELFCLAYFWVRLLHCGLDLKRSVIGVPYSTSWISAKLLAGGLFFYPSLWSSFQI